MINYNYNKNHVLGTQQRVFFAYKNHVLASILATNKFDTDPDSSDMTLYMFVLSKHLGFSYNMTFDMIFGPPNMFCFLILLFTTFWGIIWGCLGNLLGGRNAIF